MWGVPADSKQYWIICMRSMSLVTEQLTIDSFFVLFVKTGFAFTNKRTDGDNS